MQLLAVEGKGGFLVSLPATPLQYRCSFRLLAMC